MGKFLDEDVDLADFSDDVSENEEDFDTDLEDDLEDDFFEGINVEEDENPEADEIDENQEKLETKEVLSHLDYKRGKIETNMYEYMKENSEKVMNWIRLLAKTPTCQRKFQRLEENTHMTGEDIVQETYFRILKTFYDNEQRLKVCQSCTHQCKEFLLKTKKTNTEKFAEGKKCRPYMYYSYSEKDLHNYINRSVKQNIDIKLKKLTNKDGKRIVLHSEEPVGSSDDSCELGSLLSNTLGMDSDVSREITENILSKKIVFTHKLAPFTLLPDIFDREDTYVEVSNDKYNEATEAQKAQRRKAYENYNLPVPSELRAIPKTVKINMGKPIADMIKEFESRFELVPSYWTKNQFWSKLYKKGEEDDVIKIGCKLTPKIKQKLLNTYSVDEIIPLDDVLPDEHIRNFQLEQGESLESIKDAEFQAKMDMMECLPSKEDISEYLTEGSYETYLNYMDYLEEPEYVPQMEYNEKTTEIKIVDKDYRVVPLPLCVYAEISVQDFLDLCADLDEGSDFFRSIFKNSKHITSFREFWIDFENKVYKIGENIEYKESCKRRESIYRLEKLARRMLDKNISPISKTGLELFIGQTSIIDQFSGSFREKVFKLIKQEALKADCSRYVTVQKIKMPIKKRITLTKAQREERARAELNRILELKTKIKNNEIHNINTAAEDTLIPNLNPQELFSSILEKIPTLETQYVMKEVKVICTNQSDSLKTIVSI